MPRLIVTGGQVLNGTVKAGGAKNSALPLLAACIMLDGETSFGNVPQLLDVQIMCRMLNELGLRTEQESGNKVHIWNNKKVRHIAPYELVTAMRASFFVAGPILAKTGFAKVPLPGGCSIGERPVDLHLKGFEALGATISMEHGFVQIEAKNGLKGTTIHLDFPSVGATENLLMAACLAEGTTVIENAAKEPEIDDLCDLMVKAGATITGIGTATLTIYGVSKLKGVHNYQVIPDRIEAATLLIAGAITQGDVTVTDVNIVHQEPLLKVLRAAQLDIEVGEDWMRVKGGHRAKAVDIETSPFPGFPTDMQAQVMALLTVAEGKSIIKETIFENRFMHARELMRMGAKIKLNEHIAVIEGVNALSGAEVKITDLRAGAALILAALVAEGRSDIYGLKHLNRGYHDLPGKLRSLGAIVEE